MGIQHIENILDAGKHVTFYLSAEKGRYVCEISSKNKEEKYLFGDTIDELITKLERKNLQKDEQ